MHLRISRGMGILPVDLGTVLDRSAFGTQLLNVDFASAAKINDGAASRQLIGGVFRTRNWFDNNASNADGSWVNRYQGGDSDAFYTDATMQAELDPFTIQGDGVAVKIGDFAPYRASWYASAAQVQALPYFGGILVTSHPQGPADWGGLWLPEYGTQPTRNESTPHFETFGNVYVGVRLKIAKVKGIWPFICLYSYFGSRLFEIDISEVFSPATTLSFHKWFGSTVHSSEVPIAADGGDAPDVSGTVSVEFGLKWTAPGVLRWYLNDRLMRTYDASWSGLGSEPMYLAIGNQARHGGDWPEAGPMASGDVPHSAVFQYARAWSLT